MIPELKSSSKRIGQLYPVLLDYHGNVIDGEHRYGVDEGWRTMRLEHIRTEKDRLIARIISNTIRRTVPRKEKTMLLAKLGEIYLNEGVEPKKISERIMEETGMSYPWVMKYLPDKYKERPGLGGPKDWGNVDKGKVLRHACMHACNWRPTKRDCRLETLLSDLSLKAFSQISP
jgi:hypothetical protein